jgi:hypothetical protein
LTEAAGIRDPGYNYFLRGFLGPGREGPFAFAGWGRAACIDWTLGSCGGGGGATSLFCPLAWECKVAAELEEGGK